MDGFPFGGIGREVDRDPGIIAGVGLMKGFVERGGVIGGGLGHFADGNVGAAGGMFMLEVDSVALIGKAAIPR